MNRTLLKQRARSSGFTLVELMVAAVVSLMLVGVLLLMAQGIMGQYGRTQAKIVQGGDVALVGDQLVLDLESVVIPNFPAAEGLRITPVTFTGNPYASSWVKFLSNTMDEDTSDPKMPGATRAVSYRLGYQNPIDGTTDDPVVYGLYRAVTSSRYTFNYGLKLTGSPATNSLKGFWESFSAPPAGESAPLEPLNAQNLVAENVVLFQVSLRYPVGTQDVWTKPSEEVVLGRNGGTVAGNAITGSFDRMRISFIVLSREGVGQLESGVALNEVVRRFGRAIVRETAFMP